MNQEIKNTSKQSKTDLKKIVKMNFLTLIKIFHWKVVGLILSNKKWVRSINPQNQSIEKVISEHLARREGKTNDVKHQFVVLNHY